MLIPLHVLPMFGFAALAFLMIGVILAVAVWVAFRSGAAGTTKLGGFAGCMVAVALVFVAGLGAIACMVVVAVTAPAELVRSGPVKKIEAHWPSPHGEKRDGKADAGPDSAKHDEDSEDESEEHDAMSGDQERSDEDRDENGEHGLHIRVEVAGGDEAKIARWFRDHVHGDLKYHTESIRTPDGRRTRIDVQIPISDDDLRKMRDDLQKDLPGMDLPNGVTIELKSEDDD
jgi:hypothetical protein